MDILFLSIGLLAGALVGYLWAMRRQQQYAKSASEGQMQELTSVKLQLATVQAEKQMQERSQAELKQENITQKATVLDLTGKLNTLQTDYHYLSQKLEGQKGEIEDLHKRLLEQFEQISGKVMQENALRFQASSAHNLAGILNPLKERIDKFEAKVQDTYEKSLADNVSLKEQIALLAEQSKRLEEDAVNLTRALKGDKKMQGDWGEMLLESLLEKSGLNKDIHYRTQQSFKLEEGNQSRPDVVIYLPENKHLVVDSKVSLVAYTEYCGCDDDKLAQHSLNAHCLALRTHVKQLGARKYEQLNGVNSPDFVLMFVPVEPAFTLAMQHDNRLFIEALDDNIVIVTASTLLATLRTIASIWKQENQKKNVLEIARESGRLYDKFVGLLTDIKQIGDGLDRTQQHYAAAMNKLSTGKGNLIGKVENLKKLGAGASKSIDPHLLSQAEEEL
jgi:DNA recombination protein RmuC